tara:strand:+ start:878 stop:1939 length:1062 start_codon:yes stop_codon:yes gene_type:complete
MKKNDTVFTERLISLVRKNNSDGEIIQYINEQLINIFKLGFNVEDATKSVVNSYFVHGEVDGFKNQDLIAILKEEQIHAHYIPCEQCYEEIDIFLTKNNYSTCYVCNEKINFWHDGGEYAFEDVIPLDGVYQNYVKKNAEKIYQKTIKDKAKNRLLGKSDLDIFKTICLQLFKDHHITFRVYPWNESGCRSWLYKDILKDIYDSTSDDDFSKYDRDKDFKIDTDQLLYHNRACFWVDKWQHKITLLKAFNGKIDLSIGRLNPRLPLKYSESKCYLKMDWTERTRNIPKKKLLYLMPYSVIYFYFLVRNLFFISFSRPRRLFREKYYEIKYSLKYRLKKENYGKYLDEDPDIPF